MSTPHLGSRLADMIYYKKSLIKNEFINGPLRISGLDFNSITEYRKENIRAMNEKYKDNPKIKVKIK